MENIHIGFCNRAPIAKKRERNKRKKKKEKKKVSQWL